MSEPQAPPTASGLLPDYAVDEAHARTLVRKWTASDDDGKGAVLDELSAVEPPLRRMALLAHVLAELGDRDRDDLKMMLAGRWVARIVEIAPDWLPTPTNVNALPEPLRHYIHQLQTDCDPAGTIRENVILRETVAALEARLAELEITDSKAE